MSVSNTLVLTVDRGSGIGTIANPVGGSVTINGYSIDSASGLLMTQGWNPFADSGNGTVAFADFLVLSTNFNQANRKWSEGDFDGTGIVGFSDFLILSSNFNQSAAATMAGVPEPAGLLLMFAALMGLNACRATRRRSDAPSPTILGGQWRADSLR